MAEFERLKRFHPVYRKFLADQRGVQLLPDDPSAAALFVGALQALQAQDPATALRLLREVAPAAAAAGQAAHLALLHALTLMLAEQRVLAGDVLAVARREHPGHAGLHLLAARHLVSEGEFAAAEDAFARAAEADPACVAAQGALAVLRGFAGDWAGAAEPARRARLAGEDFGPNLVRLTDIFARFHAGLSTLPEMDLSALEAGRPARDFLARLPPVEGEFRAEDQARPIVFAACDEVYLRRYVPALAYSLDAQDEPVTLHVHFFGRREAATELLAALAGRTPLLRINLTAEDPGPLGKGKLGVYCSCVRLIRAWQVLRANAVPVLAVDADVLFHRGVSAFPGFCDGQADLTLCSEPEVSPAWERVIAGALLAQPTAAARAWLEVVAAVIADNIGGEGAVWFLDQIALSLADVRGAGGARIRHAAFAESCDTSLSETAVVWAVTINKEEESAFHARRRALLRQYAPADARREANPNEIVRSAHGLMILNRHDMYIGPSIKQTGHWCPSELEVLAALIGPGATVLDVGASFGFHSLALSEIVGPQGRVIAFEPQRMVWQSLVGALALNWIDNVQALNVAVGRESGVVRLPRISYTSRNNMGAVSLRPGWAGNSEVEVLDEEAGETVPLIRLDDAGLEACHLIKLDVEGMELAVLEGAAALIERCRPVCYVEFHSDREPVLGFFEARGYAPYLHDVPGNPNLLCLPDAAMAVPKGFGLRAIRGDFATAA